MDDASVGQCVRVVPSRLKPGTVEAWLGAHRRPHTPGRLSSVASITLRNPN